MSDETKPEEGQTEEGAAGAIDTATAEEKVEKLKQDVQIEIIGPCRKRIKISVAREDVDKRMQDMFRELSADGVVPGFRPGKAPRKLIENRYHKEVGEQVKTEILLTSLQQLAEDHDVAPLTTPDIDPFKIELPKEGPLVYEFEVEVRPEFDLPDYKGLKLKKPVYSFTESEINQEERRLLAPYGQVVPKAEGEPADIGDILVADVTTLDGDRVLGTFKEYMVRIEPQLAFKDGVADRFGQQVKGAKAGDLRVVDIALSRSVSDPGLAGKGVKATFEVKDVKALRLPELTPDFLKRFGVRSGEQLRELVRVSLERRLEYAQRQSARKQVLEHITTASQWDLPEDLLVRQARRSMSRRILEMQSDGMSDDEIRGRVRILEQDVLRSTSNALKEHFVLQKIAEVEKIDVNDDDLEEEVERIARQSDQSPRRVRARLEKDDLIEALATELIERKALDLILNNAEYDEVPLKSEEQTAVSTVEEQAVPGEMVDLTTPPEPEKQVESPKTESSAEESK